MLKKNHKIISQFDTIIKNDCGENTKKEIESFIDYANDIQPKLIVSVSSKDHTPRIMRELMEFQNDVDYGLTVYASENTYVKNELQPFILEGTFPNCINSLQNIFTINEENKTELSKDIQTLIDKYE